MVAGTTFRGTLVANNAAIEIFSGSTLEGRALSTNGAVTIHGSLATIPLGCGEILSVGPTAPNLASTACYAIFSSNGSISNTGTSTVTGDIGTNVGTSSGFNAINVTGTIHTSPDASTATAAGDLPAV